MIKKKNKIQLQMSYFEWSPKIKTTVSSSFIFMYGGGVPPQYRVRDAEVLTPQSSLARGLPSYEWATLQSLGFPSPSRGTSVNGWGMATWPSDGPHHWGLLLVHPHPRHIEVAVFFSNFFSATIFTCYTERFLHHVPWPTHALYHLSYSNFYSSCCLLNFIRRQLWQFY